MKKTTVTIGIPAHNEGKNISRLLNDINKQVITNFILEKVVVACDGCTDNTADVVRAFKKKHPKVTLVNDGLRLGQKGRLNQFFEMNKSDIFVTFDADTKLANSRVLLELVSGFEDSKVGIVGGHDVPTPPKTVIQRISVAGISVWYEMRMLYRDGRNAHNLHGCVIAFSKKLTKTLRIPKGIVSTDTYMYYAAIKKGFLFTFAPKAIVYYTAPSSLKDYFQQGSRFIGSAEEVRPEFSQYFVDHADIPVSLKIKGVLLAFIKDPIYVPLSILFLVLTRPYSKLFYKSPKNDLWTAATSTKA